MVEAPATQLPRRCLFEATYAGARFILSGWRLSSSDRSIGNGPFVDLFELSVLASEVVKAPVRSNIFGSRDHIAGITPFNEGLSSPI